MNSRRTAVLILVFVLFVALTTNLVLNVPAQADATAPAVGDPLPRIVCPEGYQAFVYASGLDSPNSLAFDLGGSLHVSEEWVGRITRLSPNGEATPVVSGINAPEGITFDPAGNLYVVEDVQDGRLLRIAPGGGQAVLAEGLDAPEDIFWASEDALYITQSNAEFAKNPPWDIITGVSQVSPDGTVTDVYTDTLLWSYSAIAMGPDGLLYASNEAANEFLIEGILRVDPATGTRDSFAVELVAPEGLAFSPGGGFPLYVTEEDLGDGHGRLSRVRADGSHQPLCTGFSTVEDVAFDAQGNLYVSEDATGLVIQITTPDLVPPGPPVDLAVEPPAWTARNDFSLTWQKPTGATDIAGATLKLGEPPTVITDGIHYAGAEITTVTGITVPATGAHLAYLWLADEAGNADPATAVSATLYYDGLPPDSRVSAPARVDSAPIRVIWTAHDDHSGVDTVALWVKIGEAGAWTPTGLTSSAEGAPFFLYQPQGEGAYCFATVATDRVGNVEAEPLGNGDAQTNCQTWQRAYLPLLWKEAP